MSVKFHHLVAFTLENELKKTYSVVIFISTKLVVRHALVLLLSVSFIFTELRLWFPN